MYAWSIHGTGRGRRSNRTFDKPAALHAPSREGCCHKDDSVSKSCKRIREMTEYALGHREAGCSLCCSSFVLAVIWKLLIAVSYPGNDSCLSFRNFSNSDTATFQRRSHTHFECCRNQHQGHKDDEQGPMARRQALSDAEVSRLGDDHQGSCFNAGHIEAHLDVNIPKICLRLVCCSAGVCLLCSTATLGTESRLDAKV